MSPDRAQFPTMLIQLGGADFPVRHEHGMPHFYIDTSDGDLFIRDEIGVDINDIEAAKAAAVSALPDMARDKLPDGDARTFLAIVRNAEGQALLQASLQLAVTSLLPQDERTIGGHPGYRRF